MERYSMMFNFILFDLFKVISSNRRNQIDIQQQINYVWHENLLHDMREIIIPHELNEYLYRF